jgi:hypothetical protein
MLAHNPPPLGNGASSPMIPLPVALYVSDELIFELYDGGRPCRRFPIIWERLVPAKESEPPVIPENSQNGLRTHQD